MFVTLEMNLPMNGTQCVASATIEAPSGKDEPNANSYLPPSLYSATSSVDAADALRVRHSEPLFIFEPATFFAAHGESAVEQEFVGVRRCNAESAVTSDTTAIMMMRTVVNILAPLNLSFCGLNPFWSIAPE